MRYRREYLKDRHWHKVVIDFKYERSSLRHYTDVMQVIKKWLVGEYMLQSGGHWAVIMIEDDRDMARVRDVLKITDDEYRGKGDWYNKKYSSAATNRI